MNRIVKFLAGVVLAAAAGVFLNFSTYALWHALGDQAYDQMLYPGVYGLVSLVVLVIGLRMALRAILPGFTFTRLILVAAIVIGLLHVGGYVSLSSERLQGYADEVQKWMRRAREAVPEDLRPALGTRSDTNE